MKTISFVIPVYNEEKRIHKTFAALRGLVLPKNMVLQEIVFVNDGSTDKTEARITHCELRGIKQKIRLVSYSQNRGKGYAVKRGLLASDADYTLLFDADISTPLTELRKFESFMKDNVDVIVGTRKNGKSTVTKHQPWLRETLGKGFTLLTTYSLGIKVTDFTCGFKAFSRRAVLEIAPAMHISGWGYDAEVLLIATQKHLSMQEQAVTWSNDARTRVKLYKDIPRTLLDLVQIVWIHRMPFISPVGSLPALREEPVQAR